ncbi:hypothetical protein L7F22_064099 [Adiantum nelumboides]|nr:hypothetical protein [Adiantum nelumboides]
MTPDEKAKAGVIGGYLSPEEQKAYMAEQRCFWCHVKGHRKQDYAKWKERQQASTSAVAASPASKTRASLSTPSMVYLAPSLRQPQVALNNKLDKYPPSAEQIQYLVVWAYGTEGVMETVQHEQTSDEKAWFLLQRIDFEESEERDAKRAKSSKESVAQSKWPWQGLVDNLQLAQQELSYILDFLSHVEANDSITVTNMLKPKQLLHETCSELALRASVKLHNFKKVGRYLRQTAKALEQQVDREAVFYGALMRLQQHWKVKRLRGISAGPGGNAGFTIDLSYPQMPAEIMWGLSARSAGLYSINVEQDSNGLLIADLPGQCLNTFHIQLSGPYIPHHTIKDEGPRKESFILSSHEMEPYQDPEKEVEAIIDKNAGKAVETGANLAHSILRRIQMAIMHEQIFEWTVREALQSSSELVVTGAEDRCLQLSVGHSCVLVLELLKSTDVGHNSQHLDTRSAAGDGFQNQGVHLESQTVEPSVEKFSATKGNSEESEQGYLHSDKASVRFWKDMSSFICLEQAFYRSAFLRPQDVELTATKAGQNKGDGMPMISKPKDFGSGVCQDAIVVEAVGPLKHFALTIRHRIFCSKVLLELEKLAQGVPYLFLSCHPTWNSRVTAWELTFGIPKSVGVGWRMSMVSWREAQKSSSSNFHLRVILCDASLFVEGLEAMDMEGGPDSVEWKRSKHRSSLPELSGFLLAQFAGQLVKWLYEEALEMGLNVRRNFLSVCFHIQSKDDFIVLASPDSQSYCINWWLHVRSPEVDEESRDELFLSKSHAQRFLGPINPESLRSVLVDLLSYCGDES